MKLSKSLSWLVPYLEEARKSLPEMALLQSVSTRIPNHSKEVQRSHAIINMREYKGPREEFSITLFIRKQRFKTLYPLKTYTERYSKLETLCHLAHELAHLRYWKHTPHHQILTSEITIIFMKILSDSGYISEEDEAVIKPFNS